jgi:hypothetical protein
MAIFSIDRGAGGSCWAGAEFAVTNNATQPLNSKVFLQLDSGSAVC